MCVYQDLLIGIQIIFQKVLVFRKKIQVGHLIAITFSIDHQEYYWSQEFVHGLL
jgi:hypothetical protein